MTPAGWGRGGGGGSGSAGRRAGSDVAIAGSAVLGGAMMAGGR